MPSRPPSIDSVARIAGVSRSAVSRAYTPGASVAPATRARIDEAARQVGYRPNLLARSLSRQHSRTIGIAVTRLDNPFNAVLLQQLALGLRRAGYGVRLFVSRGDDDADPGMEEIIQHRVDALIVCAIELTSTLGKECKALNMPVVMVNRRTDDNTATCITGDNYAGSACIARFLVACGHRRFAFIGGTPGSSTSRDRQAGFVSDCQSVMGCHAIASDDDRASHDEEIAEFAREGHIDRLPGRHIQPFHPRGAISPHAAEIELAHEGRVEH
ncbi:MAG: LacI family transcriptional regulator, partial [Lysobacteraceae bacterium]